MRGWAGGWVCRGGGRSHVLEVAVAHGDMAWSRACPHAGLAEGAESRADDGRGGAKRVLVRSPQATRTARW